MRDVSCRSVVRGPNLEMSIVYATIVRIRQLCFIQYSSSTCSYQTDRLLDCAEPVSHLYTYVNQRLHHESSMRTH